MAQQKKGGRYSLKARILCGLVALITLGIGALNLFYFKEVERSLMEQTGKELKQENDKAMSYLTSLVERRFEWLEVVASFCDTPDGSGQENWWEEVENFQREGSRFGIADDQGVVYFGDHKSMDVSGRRYYQEVMEGRKSVSKVLNGDFNSQDGIVLAVPIIKKGEVCGAACVEYTTAALGKNLNEIERKPYGVNIVFTKSGVLVTSSPWEKESGNVFDMLSSMEYGSGQSLDQMKAAVNKGEPGFLTFYSQGRKQLVYYQPVGILDWTVASFMTTENYEGTLQKIRKLSARFFTGSTAMLACALVLIIGILHYRRKEVEEAKKDYLTGVYTRETARKLVERNLGKQRKRGYYACMFLDIDDFKKINDTFGHSRGDQALADVGRVLKDCTRECDVIVRFGGDEFCVWLKKTQGRREPGTVARQILSEFDRSGNLHASIGIVLIKENETDYDDILNRADKALYEAKKKGKNQFAIYL